MKKDLDDFKIYRDQYQAVWEASSITLPEKVHQVMNYGSRILKLITPEMYQQLDDMVLMEELKTKVMSLFQEEYETQNEDDTIEILSKELSVSFDMKDIPVPRGTAQKYAGLRKNLHRKMYLVRLFLESIKNTEEQ